MARRACSRRTSRPTSRIPSISISSTEPSCGACSKRHFGDVWLGGVDAAQHVKADFEARRRKADRLLRLDAFDLRHRMPHSWYVWAYTRLLPARLQAAGPRRIGRRDRDHGRRLVRDGRAGRHDARALRRARAPRAGSRPADARRRADGRDRLGQVRRGRPPGGTGRRADRRRPGGPRRGGARAVRPISLWSTASGRASSPRTGPSTARRWRRSAFADEETRLELNAHHPPCDRHGHDRRSATPATRPTTSSSWPSRC